MVVNNPAELKKAIKQKSGLFEKGWGRHMIEDNLNDLFSGARYVTLTWNNA
jgi:hypothetical protein